jgi:hypothetical protein
MSPLGAHLNTVSAVNEHVAQRAVKHQRMAHAHEFATKSCFLEGSLIPGIHLNPNRVVQADHPGEVTRAKVVVVQHLRLQTFEKVDLGGATLRTVGQLEDCCLSADTLLHFACEGEVIQKHLHLFPVCIRDLYHIAIVEAFEVVDKLRVICRYLTQLWDA